MHGKGLVFDTWLLHPEEKRDEKTLWKEHIAPRTKTLAEVWQIKEEVYVLGKL